MKSSSELPLILRTEHLQEISGLSKPTIYKLLEKAKRTRIFKVRKVGNIWFIDRDSFLTWLSGELNAEDYPA